MPQTKKVGHETTQTLVCIGPLYFWGVFVLCKGGIYIDNSAEKVLAR